MTRPPVLLETWLRRVLARATGGAAYVVGDLREEYSTLCARRGVLVARAWYAVTAARLALRLRWEVRRGAARGDGRAERRPVRAGDATMTVLGQAVRYLLRRPGFSVAIVLTVSLAIAATTVAYAVVDGVLLEPLPYRDAGELVVVWEHNVPRSRDRNPTSPANFLAWRDGARTMTDLAAVVAYSVTHTGDGDPARIGGVRASASVFRLMGAEPIVGTLYGEEHDRAGGANVVVLSEGYWRRAFGADQEVAGRQILLAGDAYTILGVLPDRYDVPIAAEFGGTGTHDVWMPHQFDEAARTQGGRYLEVFGRLSPEATLAQAREEMRGLAARLREAFPERQTGWEINVLSLREQIAGDVGTTLWIIFGAVCFVLLIACANVANLQLSQAAARQQELAVRRALGSGRLRLISHLMLESLLLSVAGGIAGVVGAYGLLRLVVVAAPDLPRADVIGLDASAIGFALAATLVTALLFGLAPALHAAGGDLAAELRDRAAAARRGGARLRGALVVVQIALSLMLLVGAGLLMRSFAERLELGTGFEMERMLTAELSLDGTAVPPEQRAAFFEDLVDRVGALPGVRAASAITFAPLAGLGSASSFWAMDRSVPPAGQLPVADLRWVHHDYHAVAGVPLLAGRLFDETDRADAPLGVVINESGARQLWPGEDALGKRIAMPWEDTLRAEVIGVVGDVLFNGPDTELRTMLYWDHRQFRAFNQMTLIVRTEGAPAAVVPAIRAAVRERDPLLPIFNVHAMHDLYGDALARPRFATIALGAFAALALLLAGVGIYGVVARVTAQRTREIGIRMALGARQSNVLWMVLSRGLVLVVIGVAIGTAGALGLTRFLEGLVFGISTTDPLTFAAMAVLIVATTLLACWLPARRASRIDPVRAIRD